MCPNFEKFHQNDSNREQLEIAEGLEEYELKETEKSKNLEKYINLLDQQENYNGDSVLVDLLNNVNMSHHKIALKLIHSGYAVLVVENFEKFTNLNKKYHKNIVSLLINNGLYDEVVNNLEKFADITESKLKDIAIKIIKKGGASYLLNDYEFFIEISESEYKDIAIQMIENGDTNNLFQNINIFIGMSESDHKEIVDKMIEKGNGGLVAKNFEKFIGIKESDHTEIVKMVIENGGGLEVIYNFEKFTGIKESDHKEIVKMVIENGGGLQVICNVDKFTLTKVSLDKLYVNLIYNLEKFTGIKESDHKEIVKMVIENGGGNIVAEKLEKFSQLDKEIAFKLIKRGFKNKVVRYFERFTDIKESDHKEIVKMMIRYGTSFLDYDILTKNLKKFSQLDTEVANKLIYYIMSGVSVANNLEKFTGIKESDYKKIVDKLIEDGDGWAVANNLEKFTGIKESDHKDIADKLIEDGDGWAVANNFEKFTGIKESDHKDIADKIIEYGYEWAVANNFEKFTGIDESDHQEIVDKIIEKVKGKGYIVANNFEKFTGIKESDHKKIVEMVIKKQYGDPRSSVDFNFEKITAIVNNFEKFTGIKESDHTEIVKMMIENGCGKIVAENLEKFSQLDKEIAFKLIRRAFGDRVVYNLEKFTGIDESDYKEIAKIMIEHGGSFEVIYNFEKFTGIKESDHKGIAEMMIENGGSFEVVENLEIFTGIKESDHKGIAEMMIENGGSLEVINNLEKFTGIKESDHQGITEMMIENGGSLEVVENFEKFTGIKNYYVIIDKLLEYISSTDFLNYLYKFSQKNLDFKKLVGLFVKHGQDKYIFDLYLKLANKSQWAELFDNEQFEEFLSALPQSKNRDERRNAFTHNKYDRASQFLQNLYKTKLFYVGEEIEDNNLELEIATEFVKRFALSKQTELYEYFKALYTYEKGINNEIPQQLIDEGIESLDDLERKYKNLQKLLYSDKELLAKDLKDFTDFEIKLFSQISGKSTHSWDSGRPSMQNIIDDFIYYSKSDSYKAVPEEYEALDLVNNDIEYKFDTEKLKKEDSYYQILKQEMLEMLDINLENNNNLPELVNSIKDKIKAKKNTLPQKKDIPYIKKQLEKYDNILQNLDQIDVKDEQAYDKILKNLLTIDRKTTEKFDLTSDLRKIIYNKVLSKNEFSEIQIESLINALHDAEIKVETLLEMLSFINNTIKDHILNMKDEDNQYWDKEIWQQIVKAKNTNKLVNLLKVFNPYLGELKEDIDTVEVIEQGDHQQNISCYPDRGLVGEMSGYLGDACYTSVYPLLKNYPNVIPYKFINESDEDNKEFLGSVLVFELESKAGEKVALLRAFDIPEEYKVNINEFIETFINNISSSLEARGMKKILIPGKSGAISNYSMTLSYMKNNYIKKGQSISLSKKFAFNGYDITNNCYVVREL